MFFEIDKYIVSQEVSIRDALKKVDDNHNGFIFTVNLENEVVGLATDGDIRRALMKGIALNEAISKCTKSDFIFADVNTPRENLIKELDSHIRFIPILDKSRKLLSIVSKDFLPLREEEAIYIRSRAPVRVSFGGGGSDVTHYFSNLSGAVINSAVSIYSHATMKIRDDGKIVIRSLDLHATLEADNLEDLLSQDGPFGLVQALLKVIQPKYGFDLDLHSDFPVGSGLGGSAALCTAILGCFNSQRQDQWNQHEVAEIAFQAERLNFKIAGGWQDQYASVFGGFNFIEFNADQNVVNPIKMSADSLLELEESLILCDTGISHHSGNIHIDQKETMESKSIQAKVKENVELTYMIRNHLLRGNFDDFGRSLGKAWQLKRNFSKKISNTHIDEIYDGALECGALGGKLLGAGGGGFFIFYVPSFKKHELLRYLKEKGLQIQPFRFEPEGLQVWTSRLGSSNKLDQEK